MIVFQLVSCYELFFGSSAVRLPWVPEVCLARFPVSVNVSVVTRAASPLFSRPTSAGLRPASHEAGREKPLAPRVLLGLSISIY